MFEAGFFEVFGRGDANVFFYLPKELGTAHIKIMSNILGFQVEFECGPINWREQFLVALMKRPIRRETLKRLGDESISPVELRSQPGTSPWRLRCMG